MRRHLGLTWDEWLALPWHLQRTYREGLLAELHQISPSWDGQAVEQVWMDAGITFNSN